MNRKSGICSAFVCVLAVGLAFSCQAAKKKYISFGWEYKRLTPQAILDNAEKFKSKGIDGIGIYLCATNSLGKEIMFVSHGGKWEREAFLPQIPLALASSLICNRLLFQLSASRQNKRQR